MPKFDKPDSPNIIWGVNALDADLTKPDDSYIQTGWTQVKPPYEYENYSMNKLYQGFAYYNQLGLPEWDSATEYQANKSYVQGSNNRVYKCIQTHVNRNPATAGNETYWELFEGNRQATTLSRGTSQLATPQQILDGSSSTSVVTPFDLLNSFAGVATMAIPGNVNIPVNVGGSKVNFKVQWVEGLMSTSPEDISFSPAFPTACLGVIAQDRSTGTYSVGTNILGKSSFRLFTKDGDNNFAPMSYRYIAWGY